MTDELRDRLRRLDPMHPGVPTTFGTDTSSRRRLEDIMTDTTTTDTGTQGSRRWYAVAAAAAAVALIALIGVTLGLRGGGEPEVVAGPPLELSLGAGDSMASCLAFDVTILAGMPVAFEGTVTSVEGETITVTVDRWFTGGDAAEVRLFAPAGMEALIGGIPFEPGASYLVTATDGTVNYCGYTGVATPELRAAFEQAFPG